ncbi:MAG: hypothetical protein EOP37_28675 [Rubrivivax sp.]|nr:MAG: hypothetical protein EOP37_28675 [Rubrivivax sp.]
MRPARSLDNLPSNVIHAFNENGSVALTCAGKDSSRRAYGSDKVRGYDFELIDIEGTPPGQATLRFYTDTRNFDDLTVILTTSDVPENGTNHRGSDSAVVIKATDFDTSYEVVIDSSKYNPDKFAYPMVTDVRACT